MIHTAVPNPLLDSNQPAYHICQPFLCLPLTPAIPASPDPLQTAMKARDSQRLDAIRFLSAAIKQREIELRETGKQVGGAMDRGTAAPTS